VAVPVRLRPLVPHQQATDTAPMTELELLLPASVHAQLLHAANEFGIEPAELAAAIIVSTFPDPITLERRCRICGCTEQRGCPGGCWWVAQDLCSECQ
jgi:hypothetical protein